jgi:hypothetical protein
MTTRQSIISFGGSLSVIIGGFLNTTNSEGGDFLFGFGAACMLIVIAELLSKFLMRK